MSYEFSVDELARLYDKFRKHDKNKDRKLSRPEILSLLGEEIINATENEVDWFLDMVEIKPDADGQVLINFPLYVKGMGEFAKIGSRMEHTSRASPSATPRSGSQIGTGRGLTWLEVQRVFVQFTKADKNNSGTLSLSEMKPVFAKVVPELSPMKYADEFARIDMNRSGYVDLIEFIRWILASEHKVSLRTVASVKKSKGSKKYSMAKLRTRNHSLSVRMQPVPLTDNLRADAFKAFSAMDSDGNGILSEGEFTKALTQVLGNNLTKSEINRLYYIVDSDHSGSITFDEFVYSVAHMAEIHRLANTMKTEYNPKFEWEIPYEELHFGPKIGEGTFGVVYKGRWHGTPVAIKKLKYAKVTPSILDDFRKEVAILAKLRHPNVVLFMGACTIPPHLCIVTEFLEGGSVYSLLHQRKPKKKLTPQTIHRIALQTARGLNYLHATGIVHRDLKTLNLLLDDNYVCKLCDFGLSCLKPRPNEPQMSQQVGSPLWMAPELLRNSSYTEKVDIYSFAMCLYELEAQEVPFDDLEFDDLVKAVTQGKRPDIPPNCPAQMANLIKQCWAGDPNQRPSFNDVLDKLEAHK